MSVTPLMRIRSFDLTNAIIQRGHKNTFLHTINYNLLPEGRTIDSGLRITTAFQDDAQAEQWEELSKNQSFDCLYISSIENNNGETLNGIYYREPENISDGGSTTYNYKGSFIGPYSKYLWNIGSEEIDTDWDDIGSSSFIAGGAANEGAEFADTTITWKCVNSDWTQNFANKYLYCDNLAARTIGLITVVEVGGYDYPAIADVTIQAEIYHNVIDRNSGLAIRCNNIGGVSHGTAYGFGFNLNDDLIYFYKFTGDGVTTLKSWNPFIEPLNHTDGTSWNYAKNFTLKVIAQGNRFDCYFDDVNGDLQFLDTVFDDSYKVGWYGIYSNNADSYADDFSLKHAKPIVANLPVGAYDYNQIRMAATNRLNDDISADGLQRTIIAPDNPIEFKQQINSLNDPSVVLDLPLNEGMGTTVYDQSGNDNDGTISGASWKHEYLNGSIQNILNFDGVNDQITLTNDFNNNSNFTINVLIRPHRLVDTDVIFDSRDANDDGVVLLILAGGVVRLQYNSVDTATATSLVIDTWYLISAVVDKSVGTCQMYINGIADGGTDDISAQNISTSTTPLIGNKSYAGGGDHFDGDIVFMNIYDRAFSATEVQTKYDALSFNESTGGEVCVYDSNGEDGLWSYLEFHAKLDEGMGVSVFDSSKHNRAVTEASWATADWSTSSYNKWAKGTYHFDGAADYFTLGTSPSFTDDFTIGAWINIDAGSKAQTIFDNRDADNDGIYLFVNASDEIEFRYNTIDITSTSTLSTGVWYFIIVTIDKSNNTSQIYINGTADGSNGDISGQTIAVATNVRIGAATFVITNYFDGYMDDIFIYSSQLSVDRIKWLYENMPRTVIEEGYEDIQGWQRVYDTDHHFVGDMIVDNGLIRLAQYYRTLDSTDGFPYIYCYSDGIWEDNYRLWQGQYANGHIRDYEPSIIKVIEKYKVILEGRVGTTEWMTFENAIVTGSPFMFIKYTDWNTILNPFQWGYTYSGILTAVRGYDNSPRFGCSSLDAMVDSLIENSVQGTETEGLSLAFSTQQNILHLFTNQGNDNGWATATVAGRNVYYTGARTIDFDADMPPHWWGIGLMAFDTDLLWIDGTDTATWAGEAGTSIEWASLGSTVHLVAGGGATMTYTKAGYPAGSYRAFILWAGTGNTAGGSFTVTGAISTTTIADAAILDVGEWHFIDFIADSNDTITFSVTEDGAGLTNLNVGEIVIIPIDNSKNMPLNARNQALTINHITESAI